MLQVEFVQTIDPTMGEEIIKTRVLIHKSVSSFRIFSLILKFLGEKLDRLLEMKP